MKHKPTMTRWQFERKYPEAKTDIDYSIEIQEAVVKVAYLDGRRYEGRTWREVARRIETNVI